MLKSLRKWLGAASLVGVGVEVQRWECGCFVVGYDVFRRVLMS